MLQSKGRLLSLETPVVMGILNTTPDSFFADSRQEGAVNILRSAEQMLKDGAAILDVGGVSTKPGAADVPEAEETERVIPAIAAISKAFPGAWISVDTSRATVAREAVAAGAHIINDVSAGTLDADMLRTAGALNVPYIAMHMQGVPATMQEAPRYEDVTLEVLNYLKERLFACRDAGITDVVLDPGFGFGKTVAHNFELLNNLSALRITGCPVLAGLSRKRMVCGPLKVNPDKALNGTTALHMVALQQGASILRVHDVREAVETVQLFCCF